MVKYVNKETNEELKIWEMYEIVFEDMVKCYIEDYADEEKVSESDIKHIAKRLVYKSEYLWEVIHEHIQNEIDNL
jgi:hypothetical protein